MFTIYTTDYCPYCDRAKDLLSQLGYSYQEINVQHDPKLREEMMAKSHGRRTVPQIFIGEHHIGGCDDLFAVHRDKALEALISQFGG